jgi:hypothetical protein
MREHWASLFPTSLTTPPPSAAVGPGITREHYLNRTSGWFKDDASTAPTDSNALPGSCTLEAESELGLGRSSTYACLPARLCVRSISWSQIFNFGFVAGLSSSRALSLDRFPVSRALALDCLQCGRAGYWLLPQVS